MKLLNLSAIFFIVVSLVGCGSTTHHHHYHTTTTSTVACAIPATASTATVWCDHCKTGYVRGRSVTCRSCYLAETSGTVCTVHHR